MVRLGPLCYANESLLCPVLPLCTALKPFSAGCCCCYVVCYNACHQVLLPECKNCAALLIQHMVCITAWGMILRRPATVVRAATAKRVRCCATV